MEQGTEYFDCTDPRDYLKPAREGMKKVCVARMVSFGQAGQAGQASKLMASGKLK